MKKWWIMFPICILLSGCWDERPLRTMKLIFGAGMDMQEDDRYSLTIEMPIEGAGGGSSGQGGQGGGQGGQAQTSQVMSEDGITVRDSAYKLDRKVGGVLDVSKLRVLVIGEDGAEKGLYSFLDALYRNASSPLNAKIAIVEGKAGTLFQSEISGEQLHSEYLYKLIMSAEKESMAPVTNLQFICISLLDNGSDPVLPFMKYNEKNKAVEISGGALFNGTKMTGTITPDEMSAFLLLADQMGKELSFTIPADEGRKLTILIEKSKRKMKVDTTNKDHVTADISLDLSVRVLEYPPDHLDDEKKLNELNKLVSDELEKIFTQTMDKMKMADSDTLGFGRQIMAKDPKKFEKMNWKKSYRSADVKIRVKTKIISGGVIL
ncbi:hypothetical protein BTO30_00905 [Domibacillus antri]|uniref:Uncharacterized protein n=1 Tax=Domibacillus antri TaxID=1714264 RepID=A0A1Q8Q9P4_9BACI|nr:Ger(x)C family spore germination protein [Domibacillus antri]OLN24012.1 hypothetical protein BTO30_00905 [Domibacillus antri]